MGFEERWPVIEAFIGQYAIDPDPVLVATIREMVRIGEVPALHDQGAGPLSFLPDVTGPGPGLPGPHGSASANPSTDLPILTGPGPGLPAPQFAVLVFDTFENSQTAHQAMTELAEEMLLE